MNTTRMHRNGTSKLILLIAALVVILVTVIVVSAVQGARRTTPGTGTTIDAGTPTGPSTLGTGYVVRPFSASDLNGRIVDNSFFANQRLTMVNVWGTFCGPCIREMPDLAQLPGEFPATDFAILGVIADTPDASNEATARQLTNSTGVTYTNVIPDRSIMTEMLANVSVVPTTFFVDHTGTVVGEVLTGSRSKAEWMTVIQGVLANLPAGS
ncbi:MAG TPA: TlpA disulfide reductase family protein [Candidatus Deferrimicrobium sp.]|nr:TlpA disulfide reductase family protein [Candidatus Deferrimicrobium sp.]